MEEVQLLNQIVSLLKARDYKNIMVAGRFGVFVKESDSDYNMIVLCAYQNGFSCDEYERVRQAAEFKIVTKHKKHVNSLCIIVNRDGMFDDSLTDIVTRMNNVWLMAGDTGRIYIYENQPADFDDKLNEYLESNLFKEHNNNQGDVTFKVTPVNILFVAVNVLVYLIILIINGSVFATYDVDVMLRMGASSYSSFINGRYYELLTAMFLHFGISHLFNNMLLLTYIGCELERRIGSFSYAVVYLLSGIIGNIISLLYYSRIGEEDVVSAGASGAIFGVLGCLAVFLLINPSKDRNLTTRRLLIMAVLTIYYGFTNVGVDNAAHIGGFCFGLFSGFLLSKIFHYDNIKYKNRVFMR